MFLLCLESPFLSAPHAVHYNLLRVYINHYQIRNEVYNIVIDGSINSILITIAADTFFQISYKYLLPLWHINKKVSNRSCSLDMLNEIGGVTFPHLQLRPLLSLNIFYVFTTLLYKNLFNCQVFSMFL